MAWKDARGTSGEEPRHSTNGMRGVYQDRYEILTDVTIKIRSLQTVGTNFRFWADVCIEPGGTSKTMRIYMVQVLDHWPSGLRNGFKLAAVTEDITLSPGECQTVEREFTFDSHSWANQDNIKIIAWAQNPLTSGPAEVYQTTVLGWPLGIDCNGNQIPDECDVDCGDPNGPCDLPGCGGSSDCNHNLVPDECEEDCNGNDVPDECDTDPNDPDGDGFVYPDCNLNAVPDGCEVGGTEDCQPNGTPDLCDIFHGTSNDCQPNGIPDECEPDCQPNGIADSCDIAGETSEDCNVNMIPDECDIADCEPGDLTCADCNNNGVPDECDEDCNHNNVPDDCDTDPNDPDGDGLVYPDCNLNTVPDECEVGGNEDCQPNGTFDLCDIFHGTSNDCQPNGIPTSVRMIATGTRYPTTVISPA